MKLSKQQKDQIKDSRPSGVMSEEKRDELQGKSHSEFNRPSSVGSFLDEWEDKYKK